MPLAAPSFWHHHFGKVSAGWALLVIVPFAVMFGVSTAIYELLHLLLLDYIPFIVLLLALFTVTGGIHIKGNLHGTPSMNTALLAIGTVLASWMGTTGAVDAADPPAAAGQRRPAAQGPRRRLLHLPGGQHRRRADAARRSAAVPRLPEGRQLLLDDHAPVQRDAGAASSSCWPSSSPSTATGTARKATSSAIPRPKSPVRSRAASTSCCWRRRRRRADERHLEARRAASPSSTSTLELQHVAARSGADGDLLCCRCS